MVPGSRAASQVQLSVGTAVIAVHRSHLSSGCRHCLFLDGMLLAVLAFASLEDKSAKSYSHGHATFSVYHCEHALCDGKELKDTHDPCRESIANKDT